MADLGQPNAMGWRKPTIKSNPKEYITTLRYKFGLLLSFRLERFMLVVVGVTVFYKQGDNNNDPGTAT